ncbi:unnamed protein product [marine sediment metagenome]|uniref:Uncharacterized protein n=1 Tax=marine sediment metagenome TaxID=412755 RepID=X1BMY5_9ZZZZ
MSVVAWITLGLLGANVTLVIIAYGSFRAVSRQQKQSDIAVRRQQKQSEKAMLLQIRYRLESDVTQIRIMKAQLIGKKPGGWKKLEDREKECSKTISELAERIRGLEKDLG